jgi:hypothetical protein
VPKLGFTGGAMREQSPGTRGDGVLSNRQRAPARPLSQRSTPVAQSVDWIALTTHQVSA